MSADSGQLEGGGSSALEALTHSRVGMCLIDDEMRYIWANEAFSKPLGYAPSDLVGKTLVELTHPDDVDLQIDLGLQVYRGEIDHFNIRKRFIARDGTEVECDVLATACFDEAGEPIIGVGIQINAETVDPTSRRIETLQRTATIGALAAAAVHELRNSMATISLATESLDRSAPPDRAIELIRTEIESSLALLTSMAAFGSPTDSMTEAPSSTSHTVGELVEQVGELLRLAIPASMSLTIDIVDNGVPNIEPRAFQQVLVNLILNARDATIGHAGSISITATVPSDETVPFDGGFIDIAVTDTGAGISEAHLNRIFEPYFTTRGDAGTGLGLPICKEIIERHGGRVMVESTLGEGSTFTIRLPTWQADQHMHNGSDE